MIVFFDNFEKICKEKGTTPTTVTKKLGFSTGSMSQWKNGSSPTANVVLQFADYLGVSTDALMGRDDLIDLYTTGIRVWANNQFFAENERNNIREHFEDLLARYRDYINCICELRTGISGEVNLLYIRQQSADKLEALHRWIDRLPEYYFGKIRESPTLYEFDSQLSSEEYDLLMKFRKLDEDKRQAIETLIN